MGDKRILVYGLLDRGGNLGWWWRIKRCLICQKDSSTQKLKIGWFSVAETRGAS